MNRAPTAAQNDFHERLTRYVNGRFSSRTNVLLSMLTPDPAYRREAPVLSAAFRAMARARPSAEPVVDVTVPVYTGDNPHARDMMRELGTLETHLAGAYLHGSIATGEEIAYSDFDALVILRDRACESPATLAAVAARLTALQRLMQAYDPLQHHGWFVLTETDLQNYCEAWFPVVLFAHARSLLPTTGTRLSIRPRDSLVEFRTAFAHLAAATLRTLEASPLPAGAYQLKGLLSQFMLLPCLYLQARDGTTVFKRESFALAARDFPAATWAAMDSVSVLRAQWGYESTTLQRLALTRTLALRRIVTRTFRPTVAPGIRAALTPGLRAGMAQLIRAMQERIAANTRVAPAPHPADRSR